MTDEKKTHRYVKTVWKNLGQKYTWDFDITSQKDWDEVLKCIKEDNAYLKEHFDKLPKKVPSDLKVWEDAIGMIENSYFMTEEEDVWGEETDEEDFETKELKG
tara:strand:- start:406 stop:714 length:309 start_codon:yes stop_codon:yes gene_type:complete